MRQMCSSRFFGFACHVALLHLLLPTAAAAAAAASDIECINAVGQVQKISPQQINDGYCDCVLTGQDEINTAACAGLDVWPGIVQQQNKEQKEPPKPVFVCPKQPDLLVPASKIMDGICDCCDGADEPAGDCVDDCQAILAEQRRAQEELLAKFKTGSAKRKEELKQWAAHHRLVVAQIGDAVKNLAGKQEHLGTMQALLVQAQVEAYQQRKRQVESWSHAVAVVSDSNSEVSGLLEPLTDSELIDFITLSCQVAGEVSLLKDKTCVPLRWAGLNVGLTWQSGTYQLIRPTPENESGIARLLDYNLHLLSQQIQSGENKSSSSSSSVKYVWNVDRLPEPTKKKTIHGRRLQAEYDDYGNDDHIYDEEMFDNEEEEENYERNHRQHHSVHQPPSQQQQDAGDIQPPEVEGSRRDELLEHVKKHTFGTSRVLFLSKSADLLAQIEKLQEKQDMEEIKMDDTEGEQPPPEAVVEATTATTTEVQPSFDPMALPMVKNLLEKRKGMIERGLDYAVSSRVLLDAVVTAAGDDANQLRNDLYQLALGTVLHGNLSAVHVWQILQAVVPDLRGEMPAADDDDKSCRSPWSEEAGICPPKQVTRRLGGASAAVATYPPAAILEAARLFCQKQQETVTAEFLAKVCAASATENAIPSDIPDGYFGYYETHPRDLASDDPFSRIFAEINDEKVPSRVNVDTLEKEVERLQNEKDEMEKDIATFRDSIGGSENSSKYGTDGELYAIRDECYSIEEGKYEYEVCMFKGAKQRDKGQKHGGTDLGRWTGAEVDEDTGRRVWKWEGGTHCWNGPQRSATVYVTCGSETTIVSADEPDTCRYVFEMEAPIACDDDFKASHNL